MHPVPVYNFLLTVLFVMITQSVTGQSDLQSTYSNALSESSATSVCNCSITQAGATYPINALVGTQSAVSFYSYGNPNGSSANTGLESANGLTLFLYEDINTGIISLFLIADIANSGTGGSMTFEANCLPLTSYISVQDDPGEFNGVPPLITGSWSWGSCCTDGGVIENLGCTNSINLDLLVSSGIDSIVWLTGDIANPTHILLALSGEAITINCGGSVCCPIGLDTEVTVTDATCEDTPNGIISLSPQDGLPAYFYNWSNGASTATNSGLLPGIYMVTVTDAQGCTEELTISVDYSPGDPPAQTAMIKLCSVNTEDYFDLTSVDNIINLGSGFNVLWFENADMTGDISDPSDYLSGTATVYAVVDNGPCLSDPVPVNLIILVEPVANTASLNACEEDNEMAIFNLTSLDGLVNNGNGTVVWFLDPLLTNEIGDPEEFLSESTIVYAVIEDGPCTSQPVEINLIVDLQPVGDETEMHLCGDINNEAIFDLTSVETTITGGNGIVTWFLEFELLDEITSPTNFQTTTTTVYAVIFDGICYSDGIPVDLIVEPVPAGIPIMVIMCADQNGEAVFNLWDYESQVGGSFGAVDWYFDNQLNNPIPNPESFATESIVIYAFVDNGTCISEPVTITLTVSENLPGYPTSIETCADTSGLGIFNLTLVDLLVSDSIGIVKWFEDAQGNINILDPANYLSASAIVFAKVIDSICSSDFIPVTLTIIDAVSAQSVQYGECDDGAGIATFNLQSLEMNISGGIGQVNWFVDSMGTQILLTPGMFQAGDTTIYASVSAGSCTSEIVPVNLYAYQTPLAMNAAFDICGDLNSIATIDLSQFDNVIANNMGIVTWYGDAGLNTEITFPATFLTGDTLLYAVVSNNECTSSPASIQINVSQELAALPLTMELCKNQGESIDIDLTTSDFIIGNGLQVNWFADAAGSSNIIDPDSYSATSSQILYAQVTDGMCPSPLVPIEVIIMDWPVANPFDVQKCGDNNGQIIFDLTSVESFVSENTGTVTWYADNLLTNEINNINNFLSGDTTLFALVTNGFCYSGPVQVTLEIVDSLVANATSLEACATDNNTAFINLSLSDFDISGGNGTVYWFTDNLALDTIFQPSSFATTSTTVFAMITADGCVSNLAAIPIDVFMPLAPPIPGCDSSAFSEISFSWTGAAIDFGYEFVINDGTVSGPYQTSGSSLVVDALSGGDKVTLSVWSIGGPPCGNSDTVSITCFAKQCPDASLFIEGPGFFCSNGEAELMNVMIDGLSENAIITWSGNGIIDPAGFFDPQIVLPGRHEITVVVNDGGCTYTSSSEVYVNMSPESEFIIDEVACLDSTLFLQFSGYAWASSEWNWDFAGANVSPGPRPVDFYLKWNEPGHYDLSLWIKDREGCVSDTFTLPVEIESPLATPSIICEEEDYYSLLISWEPVIGATEYIVSSSLGDGKLSGNSYSISNLPDNTAVNITVTAIGSVCGPTSASIECHTPEYIPLKYYIPDIFSPNGDGINDIIFVQSNTQVKEVNTFRIFDRWGDMIFEDLHFLPNDPQYGWNGSFAGKEMNPGVYLYWIELETADGKVLILSGDITLIR